MFILKVLIVLDLNTYSQLIYVFSSSSFCETRQDNYSSKGKVEESNQNDWTRGSAVIKEPSSDVREDQYPKLAANCIGSSENTPCLLGYSLIKYSVHYHAFYCCCYYNQ